MKIVIDDKIPYIIGIIENFGINADVVYLPGKSFTRADVCNADALIIRTRTHCDKELLEGSKVKLIATATIGYDHIDTKYCDEAGIYWTNCPGCNSESVAQYMQSVLLLLKHEKGIDLKGLTLGVVGVGHVGSKVVAIGEKLGMKVLMCDPPRAKREGESSFCSMDEIVKLCDIVTFHTPLVRTGRCATYHLADKNFFDNLVRKTVIINTSRGEVVDNEALLQAINDKKVINAVIDVWENEPNILLPLLNKVFIGTPHIAGYAADGKANATRMSLEAFCKFFNIDKVLHITPTSPSINSIMAKDEEAALLQIYNPHNDSDKLKAEPEKFEWFRGHYPLRRERQAYKITYIGI